MVEIKLGENITIDIEKLIETRMLICANSGGGKSYLARKLFEESHGKVQIILLDIEGEYSSLREKYDFLLIGHKGDIPASLKTVTMLPKKIMSAGVSTIIDLSELKSKDRLQYIKKFIESLMDLPRKYWKPCLVGVEEAHKYCGQQDKHESGPAIIDLMSRGRKRGLAGVLMTQRIAKLHKDAVAECNNVFVGRMWLDIDQKRAGDILGLISKEEVRNLRLISPGDFYYFGPAVSTEVLKGRISTVKTVHPKIGMKMDIHVYTSEKISQIAKEFADLPKEIEQELKDLNDYKNKVAELTRNIKVLESSKIKPEINQKQLERAENNGYRKGISESRQRIAAADGMINRYVNVLNKIACNLKIIPEINNQNISLKELSKNLPKESPDYMGVVKEFNKNMGESNQIHIDESPLPKCAAKIYSFLFENPDKVFSLNQVCFMTGYSMSGSLMTNIYTLTGKNLAIKEESNLRIGNIDSNYATEKIGKFSIENIFARLPKCAELILRHLIEYPNEEFTKSELCEITNYSMSGSFMTNVYTLTGKKFAIKSGNKIKLNPELLEL